MAAYKVEICGVNTAKLPILKESEKEELFAKIKQGDMAARETYIKGNLLMDPYSNLPVSLIEKNTLEMLTGEEPVLYRYIPFVSLGEEHGMVQAVILDSLYIKKEKKEIAIQPAVFAIVEEKFLKDSTYRIILNGRLW